MKKLYEFYVARAELIGLLYCALPTLAGYGIVWALMPFRGVYLVRLALALALGGPVAAGLNRYGLSLWMIKHGSSKGPASIRDGLLIGMALGWGMALLPSLTHLLQPSNLEKTKSLMLLIWLGAGAAGAVMGSILATIGRTYADAQTYLQQH
jgi:hypothetical protein